MSAGSILNVDGDTTGTSIMKRYMLLADSETNVGCATAKSAKDGFRGGNSRNTSKNG